MVDHRFKALLGMIHVSDPTELANNDKLQKIRPLLDHMASASKAFYQPNAEVTIDERMVKSKGRSGIRQFIANKPVRFGFKLWCMCDSKSGYTVDFK